MVTRTDSNKSRQKRHTRVRAKITGTSERPRLNVFRSEAHIYAQIIDDTKGVTLCSASSVEKDFDGKGSNKAERYRNKQWSGDRYRRGDTS